MADLRPTATVVAVGLVAGGLTSVLQTWLPDEAASFANSAGPWCALAFVLARWGRGPGAAAAYGALTLVALDLGYYATAAARGYPTSTAHVALWVLAALLVGPVLGVGARWLDARHPVRRALGVAVLPTLLVAEGARSWIAVGDTTFRPYWAAEVVAGVLLAALLATRIRARRRSA